MDKIVIGSRESQLALAQTKLLQTYINEQFPQILVSVLKMKTTGDKILDRPLELIGGKGLFVKELDRALLSGKSHLSVHSLKDLPMEVSLELPILGFSKREDPRDVLVLPLEQKNLDFTLPIGCQSRRRTLQLKELYPQAQVKSVRGNVITRLQKLDQGEYSGLILAAAGLKRLGLEHRISRYFNPTEMLPAAGQGVLAIQGRKGLDYPDLSGFFDAETTYCVLGERSFVRTLEGGCTSPVAANGVVIGQTLQLTGLFYNEETGEYFKETMCGDPKKAEEIGQQLAIRMREKSL